MHKEDVYAIIFFGVLGIAVPCVVVIRHFAGIDILHFMTPVIVKTILGVALAVLATLVCVLNFYLSFISPWLYKREHGSMKGYGSMSGLPIVGGFFVLGAGALMPESTITGIFLLALYALDTGGVPWVFIMELRSGAS